MSFGTNWKWSENHNKNEVAVCPQCEGRGNTTMMSDLGNETHPCKWCNGHKVVVKHITYEALPSSYFKKPMIIQPRGL